MSPTTATVISIFSTLVLLGIFAAIFFTGDLFLSSVLTKNKFIKKATKLITDNSVALILIVSAMATVGSLTFSEVLGFNPCKLCWYQRIAMYPITIISFISLITNDNKVKNYILPLSIGGFVIAVYHILVQLFPTILECSDEVAKCSAVSFAQYGFITIPVMSATAFALIILISLFGVLKKK